jgi:hypothetical protein
MSAYLHRGVLEVGARTEGEHLLIAARERAREPGSDVCRRLQRVDFGQRRLDRVEAGGVDRGLVHAGGVQIADLPLDGIGPGLIRFASCLLDDRVLIVEALFRERVKRAPARTVGRNRVGGDPTPVDERIEIRACVHAGVQQRDIEHGRGRRGGGKGGRRFGACARFAVAAGDCGAQGGDDKGKSQRELRHGAFLLRYFQRV